MDASFECNYNCECSRFVRYTHPESVLKAVQEVCEWMLHGKILKVEIAMESREALRLALSGECLSTVMCFHLLKGDPKRRCNWA